MTQSHRSPGRREQGFTLLEMVITITVLLTVTFLVTNLIMSGNAAQKFNDRLRRVTGIAQDIQTEIQDGLNSAVRVFGNDTLGQAYAVRLAAGTGVQAIASTRLPDIKSSEIFSKDTVGSEKTGNALLFVRHAWADTFTCVSTNTYRVDVYRMVGYYMTGEDGGPDPSHSGGLNLVKWTSEPMVNGLQIDRIADATDQAQFLVHLRDGTPDDAGDRHDPMQVVWMLAADPSIAGTFREILASGALSDSPQSPRADPWEIERAVRLSNPGMLYYRHHSVCSNYARANMGQSRFGLLDNTAGGGVGFPHGFEIQIIGFPAALKVLIHLTTISTNRAGLKAHHDSQIIVVVREG